MRCAKSYAIHSAAHFMDAFERIGQGHRDKTSIDDPAGDVWHQRRVEHVIDRRNDRDVDWCEPSAENSGETADACESGEAAADDHD